MIEVNPYVWYGTRKLSKPPTHFVKANTATTEESEFWIKTKLSGRYAIVDVQDITMLLEVGNCFAYFEDPSEAMLYELRWSGSK